MPGSDNNPYGIRAHLSRGIIGRVCLSHLHESQGIWTNRIMTRELTSTYKCGRPCCGTIFVLKSCIKKFFNPGKVNKLFELDFQE